VTSLPFYIERPIRRFCAAAYDGDAWIVCSAASTAASAEGYIALQQKENPLEMLWVIGFCIGDDAMAYARTAVAPRGFLAVPRKPGNWRGLLRRLGDALEESHQRAMDREIAAYLQSRGRKLTDSAEREIEEIMYSSTRW